MSHLGLLGLKSSAFANSSTGTPRAAVRVPSSRKAGSSACRLLLGHALRCHSGPIRKFPLQKGQQLVQLVPAVTGLVVVGGGWP